MNPYDAGAAPYALGHSDVELNRLKTQARLIDPITYRFLAEAGIQPGMRVLDVGCGAGSVTFLAAELVGETGEVVGADRASQGIAVARGQAASRSLRKVTFREGDPAEMTFEQPFDAVIGRYVLMFQKDPAVMLRKLASLVRPKGLIVFHEVDYDGSRSVPPAPTYDQCCRWIVEALRDSDIRMGIRLHSAFIAAGLPAPSMRLEALIGAGATSFACLDLVAGLVGTLLPELERLGIARPADVGLETLSERLNKEAIANGSVTIGRFEIGAWCRV